MNRVIKGWQKSIAILNEGGKGKFIIPSRLAYGSRGADPKSGSNFVLIFDIELIKIVDEEKENQAQLAKDQKLITDHLAANNLKAEKTESGIHYIMEKEGTGDASPDQTSMITAHYH